MIRKLCLRIWHRLFRVAYAKKTPKTAPKRDSFEGSYYAFHMAIQQGSQGLFTPEKRSSDITRRCLR